MQANTKVNIDGININFSRKQKQILSFKFGDKERRVSKEVAMIIFLGAASDD